MRRSDRNHTIDWKDWKILSKDNKHYRLLIRESLYIADYKPNLNRTTCSAPLIIYPEGIKTKKPKVKIKSVLDALPEGE